MKAVVLCSGGMDSVTLAYLLAEQGVDLHLLSVAYGQKHEKELECARLCAERLTARFSLISVNFGNLLQGCALTDPLVPVPDGHYADAVMAQTIVPNRNAVLANLAVAVAVAEGADLVGLAIHAGDHPIYPDCRPEFLYALQDLVGVATGTKIIVYAPFLMRKKSAVVYQGTSLGVPYGETWSCYKGGEVHCGTCGTCVERKEAFRLVEIPDPTTYEDDEGVYRG